MSKKKFPFAVIYSGGKEVEIKETCFKCGYVDKSLGRGKCCKCFTKSCPVRILGEVEMEKLLTAYKRRLGCR